MEISVKFMSQFRALAAVEETTVELPDGATVADLLESLRGPFPDIFPTVRQAMIMVNHKIVAPEVVLREGDRVMLLQLLGGG